MKEGREISGFTLLEVLVAMLFFMLCSVGLLAFTMTSIGERKSIERRSFAYNMIDDVIERLRGLPVEQGAQLSQLVRPSSAHEDEYFKYDEGKIKTCSGGNIVDTWTLINPLGNGNLYLYDSNHNGQIDSGEINSTANSQIDHPSSGNDYSAIIPIRKDASGTTYYSVWTVRYFPCGFQSQVKIFAAVYWIEPEPTESESSAVVSKINSGVYKLKRVTTVTDRVYGVSR
ncbi:MAG: hypothetical protein WHS38_11030 [Thermodesulforhabdaceae bacterium]